MLGAKRRSSKCQFETLFWPVIEHMVYHTIACNNTPQIQSLFWPVIEHMVYHTIACNNTPQIQSLFWPNCDRTHGLPHYSMQQYTTDTVFIKQESGRYESYNTTYVLIFYFSYMFINKITSYYTNLNIYIMYNFI
jgi:hypothetical protein